MAAAIGLAFFGESPVLADFIGAAVVTAVCVWVATNTREQARR
jgi:drug/metabolite transporter (DMT)-like permease